MNKMLAAIVVAAAVAPSARAQQEHEHSHGAAEQLGTVHFPTSCRPDVAEEFTRGVALLHSFGYEESRLAFQAVAEKDPSCGMAYWGIAMTYYHPIWAAPSPEELAAGKAASVQALDHPAKTERENGYIAAIAAFYSHEQRLDHGARAAAYRDAMEALSRRDPGDHEATIFYALSLLGTAPPSDPSHATQKKAAAILNGLLPSEPEHPGIAHYMIHAFDYPDLADEALPAARAYSKIAPSAPHALHMPSHIFTRLGLWRESIASNLASAEAGDRLMEKRHPGATHSDTLHAFDYLEYAYLQLGDQTRARKILEKAAAAHRVDERTFSVSYALDAIPARWALERRDWKAASELADPAEDPAAPYAPALTYFAQALGAARSGRLDRSREALERLGAIQASVAKTPIPGPYNWANQIEAMRLSAEAWAAFAQGRKDEAVATARAAAELDEKTGKHPVTPGALLPPRELLGDMLLEMGKPAEALAEYEAALRQAPNRFNGLYGAARAAELSHQPARARELYGKLAAQCGPESASERPELARARRYLEKGA